MINLVLYFAKLKNVFASLLLFSAQHLALHCLTDLLY